MVDSSIGNIYPFIKDQAKRSRMPLSYLSGAFKEPASWKNEARAKILELLRYSPEPCTSNPNVVEVVDHGDYVREKLYFHTAPGMRVPAYVLVPKNTVLPAPGIVALHCHGGMYRWGKEKLVDVTPVHPVLAETRQRSYSGRCIANELVRRGYVVITIDAFYFGERRLMLSKNAQAAEESRGDVQAQNDLSRSCEDIVAKTFFMAGITWPGIVVWDDIRTVDYLVSRPEVDPNRIGCMGLSFGGWRSVYLAGLEPRIKCAVVLGWMSSLGKMLANHVIKHTWMLFVPGQYQYMDLPDVASLMAPNPLLVIHGRRDELFPPEGVQEAFEKLAEIYKLLGSPENFRASTYDSPHEFNTEMQEEAFSWMDSVLKREG